MHEFLDFFNCFVFSVIIHILALLLNFHFLSFALWLHVVPSLLESMLLQEILTPVN